MKCPVCADELVRTTYEGSPVFRCEKCFGYLVGRKRAEGIKRTQQKTVAQLKNETLDEGQQDTEETIRCPRCRMKMKKKLLEEPVALHVDRCKPCDLVWFDGGELARIQLGHQITPQAQEAAQMQRRMAEMDPERRRQFEENLDKLPVRGNEVLSLLVEAVSGPRRSRRWRIG